MVVLNEEKMKEAGSAPGELRKVVPVVLVAGVSSGAGKTSLAEAVLRTLARLHNTGAAKITVTHGERGCPHGGKGCDVCGSLGGQYQVITRDSIIRQPGTDTARLLDAGASEVLWTITREEFIQKAWMEMSALLSHVNSIVVESNTLALVIKPALTLMIVDPTRSRQLWKPSAERLIAEADYIIFNDRGPESKRRVLLDEVLRLRGAAHGLLLVSHPHEIEHQPALNAHLKDVCGD